MTQLESFLARRLNVSFSFLFSYLPECIRFLSPFLFRLETLLSFHQRFSRGFFLSLSLSLGADNGPVRLAARLKSNVCHVHRPRRLVIGARERQLHLKKSMLRWKVSYGLRNPCLFRVTSGSFDTSLGGIVFFASNLCTIINLYTTLRVEF